MPDVLSGKRIVNTRALHQAGEFDTMIAERGGIPLSYPCIAIQPPDDTTLLDNAIRKLLNGVFDWLVLTSANTVYSLSQRLHILNLVIPSEKPFRVAAVGTSTADAISEYLHLATDLIPDDYIAEALAAALLAQSAKNVFLPQSAIARPTLAQRLQNGGATVQVATAYETVAGSGGISLAEYLWQGKVDVLTFTSSSTVENCVLRLLEEKFDSVANLSIPVLCIGSKTAKTAIEQGFKNVLTPQKYTLSGMLDVLDAYFQSMM